MEQVRGVPELLEAYSEDTLPALARARDALHDYRAALSAFNAAHPNDLGSVLSDRSPEPAGALDALQVLDRIPAAFGAALRQLDATYDPAASAPGALLHTSADARLRRLILDGVAGPWASGAERARVAQVLRLWDDLPDAPAPVAFAVRHEDWRSTLNQFGRHLGNSLMSGYESRRLTALRARYPVAHPWYEVTDLTPEVIARSGGIHNRNVHNAARSTEHTAAALRANGRLLPTLGVHLPPGLLTAGKAASRTVGGLGIVVTLVDLGQDIDEGDVGGSISSGASLAGSLLLVGVIANPLAITAGAVLVVGSLIYEANREEIDAMARSLGQSMNRAARAVGDLFDF